MERAAFKLTAEYVEVLGGKESPMYEEFIQMFSDGLAAARKYATVTITMMEIMMFQVIRGFSCAIGISFCVLVLFGGWLVSRRKGSLSGLLGWVGEFEERRHQC